MPKKAPPPPPLPTLPMHLALSLSTWLASPLALSAAKNALPFWKEKESADPAKLLAALNEEAQSRAVDMLAGIARYLATPYQRDANEPAVIWQRGAARLLDYSLPHRGRVRAASAEAPKERRGMGALSNSEFYKAPLPASPLRGEVIALFVPSLINRYYILDLEHERSLLRYLSSQGIRPLVLDWGAPGKQEKDFGAEEYVRELLLPAIDHLHKTTGEQIALAGYCMGGVFALAAAQLRPKKLSSLSLFATPWDFHCKSFSPFLLDSAWQHTVDAMLGRQSTLPAEAIQSLFYLTDPWVFENKFRRFFGMDPKSRSARDFVALEHWVNDGIPMTARLARDCLIGWAQQNQLAVGGWQIADKIIDPAKIKIPTFIAIPKNDHVVPYDCAWPLAAMMKHATIVHPSSGHVGMMVGERAKKELWQPLSDWFKSNNNS